MNGQNPSSVKSVNGPHEPSREPPAPASTAIAAANARIERLTFRDCLIRFRFSEFHDPSTGGEVVAGNPEAHPIAAGSGREEGPRTHRDGPQRGQVRGLEERNASRVVVR